MRFLLFLTQVETAWESAPTGEPERVYEQYMKVESDLKAQGKLIESLRLRPGSAQATTLSVGKSPLRIDSVSLKPIHSLIMVA